MSHVQRDCSGGADALGVWGERWLEVTTDHTDPGFVLWSWVKYYIDSAALPDRRILVDFTFPDEPPTNRRYWLLAEGRAAELCYSHPGGEPDVFISAESEAFTRWHVGRLDWRQALAHGSITVVGPTELARALPTWNRHPQPLVATVPE